MKKCIADFTTAAAAALILTICGCRNGKQDITIPPRTDITTVSHKVTEIADTASAAAEEGSAPSATEARPDEKSSPIAETAEALIGVPFLYGGASPSGFDNSGFIYYVLRKNGYISCPRTISEQLGWASDIGYNELSAGDIAYFSEEPDGEASIGGVYVGDGKMVFAPSPEKTVCYADITADYWKSRFAAAITL